MYNRRMKVQIILSDELVKRIDMIAKNAGVTRSSIISVCMLSGLKNMGFDDIVLDHIDKKGGQQV